MDANNTIYSNAFRIAINSLETQILFKLETPVINEAENTITGSTQINIADIRLHPKMAKELYIKLKEQIDFYEENYGKINLPDENN